MIDTKWRRRGDPGDPPEVETAGDGGGFLHYSFDDERDEVTVTCPDCGNSCVTPCQPEPGQDGPTLEHESDCQLLTFIESFENHGGLIGN